MTHYTTHYDNLSREQADIAAIHDIEEYLGSPDKMQHLINAAEMCQTVRDIVTLNMSMAFAGISGRPFHALCRRHCLNAYRMWMADGEDSVPTDEQGFAL